jgi:hypothetical protein
MTEASSETIEAPDAPAPDAGATRYYQPSDFQAAPEKPETFEGPDAVKRATANLTARREQPPPPIKKRDARTLPKKMSVADAADALKLTHQIERGSDLVMNAGVDFDDAVAAVRAGEPEPTPITYQDPEAKVPKSAREAGKDLAGYRAHQQALAEQAAAEQQQGLAATVPANEPEAEPVEPQHQPDIAEEHQRLAQERAAIEQLRGLTAHEVQAVVEIEQMKSAFSDLKSWADVEHLAKVNPQRFQQLLVADQEVRHREARLQGLAQHKQAAQIIAAQQGHAEEANAIRQAHEETNRIMEAEVPELRDPARAAELRAGVQKTLRDLGLTSRSKHSPSACRPKPSTPAREGSALGPRAGESARGDEEARSAGSAPGRLPTRGCGTRRQSRTAEPATAQREGQQSDRGGRRSGPGKARIEEKTNGDPS